MLQFLSIFHRTGPGARLPFDDIRRWRADPLSHPAIERMCERELADLPMAPAIWRERR